MMDQIASIPLFGDTVGVGDEENQDVKVQGKVK